MYQPPHFIEDRLAVKHDLIRAHPFGMLVSAGPEGLLANGVPFVLDADASASGTLKAHVARANPQWRHLAAGATALAIFQGPQAYVTPSWYATKRETGKVVPTWNYAIVQARGPVTVHEDAEWLARQVRQLTRQHEESRSEPWAVDDAPADFLVAQMKGIVGIEMEITEIDGKWKVSQNRPVPDRIGVAAGLDGEPDAADMTALVRAYGGVE